MSLDKDHLLKLISLGNTRQAINELLAQENEIAEDTILQIVSLSAELSENEKNASERTVSQEILTIQRNGINKSLTTLIAKVDTQALPSTQAQLTAPKHTTNGASTDQSEVSPTVKRVESTYTKVEKGVETVAFVISQIIKRPWKYKLMNLIALLLIFLNPGMLKKGLELIGLDPIFLTDIQYPLFYWSTIGLLLIGAIALAVRDKLVRGKPLTKTAYNERSPIKGLKHFDFEDADIFKKLQRHQDIEICWQGINGNDYRFGVLTGESGCGKTSFLRAGLHPAFASSSTLCVVVKCRNEAPLLSIRKALAEQLHLEKSPSEKLSLKDLLQYYLEEGNITELVLIIDQFEQFFTQFKQAESRAPFIQQLKACYDELAQVKILVSLRKDYQGYLYEIQDILGYALIARTNYFDLKKFTPTQATEIFKVIAETEGLEFDPDFVYTTCKEELASKDDGWISAVDIQILAFIIKGQQLEEKAFTRSAFQQMGGIDGLLLRYLQEHFEVPNRYHQDQAALNVLLAFIDLDHNVRVGDLTVKDLVQKTDLSLSLEELQEILDWLEELRLVTKSESKEEGTQYELAHERLIPPVRQLAGKVLPDLELVNQLLHRRTNEWINNERNRRFLLSFRELWKVNKYKHRLSWGNNELQKRELVNASKRYVMTLLGGVVVLTMILTGLVYRNAHIERIKPMYAVADSLIVALEYDAAAMVLHQAGNNLFQRKKTAQKLLEVAFYLNEIGETQRAQRFLQDTVFQISSSAKGKEWLTKIDIESITAQKDIRKVLQAIDLEYYQEFLMKRYFPLMIEVKGGTFQMGNLSNDAPPDSARVVTLSDFKMAQTETTVWQYELFARATGRAQDKRKEWDWIGDSPAIYVSWYDAIAYANWVSERLGAEKVYQLDAIPSDPNELDRDTLIEWQEVPNWEASGFRLPTEAEWEYAARGGVYQDPFRYAGSDEPGDVAWYSDNVALADPFNRTHPVKTKKPNSLELYDMSGNVSEWCWDNDGNLDQGKFNDPKGSMDGYLKVVRGGSWIFNDDYSRVSYRLDNRPNIRHYFIGFRLCWH